MSTRDSDASMLPAAAGPIALELTLLSGQVFHWQRGQDGSWEGLIGGRLVRVREENSRLMVRKADAELAARYFALDHPLDAIYASFPRDPLSQSALEMCRGMRIIRQPAWECLATFITSSMKQVAHIRQMSLAIRGRFGTRVGGHFAYPAPEALARATEASLRSCGLGYRAANLLATARLVASGAVNLEELSARSTDDLRSELTRLPGVGVKVANCVLLFAYERLDAVPIDVWIRRVLLAMRRGRGGTPAQLARYARLRLGPHAGYVQQYLFHRARVSSK